MELRSGKLLSPPLCNRCKKFYGNSIWNWKCSNCNEHAQTQASLFHTKEFQEKLQIWVKKHIADNEHLRALKWCANNHSTLFESTTMSSVLVKLVDDKKYITAAFAVELLRNCGLDNFKKSHFICPFILDWWNMRKHNYKPYELCYYGRYGEDPAQYISSIPPPMPNPPLFPIH